MEGLILGPVEGEGLNFGPCGALISGSPIYVTREVPPTTLQPLTNIQGEDTGNPNGTSEAIQTERHYLPIISISESHTEGCKEWSPGHLVGGGGGGGRERREREGREGGREGEGGRRKREGREGGREGERGREQQLMSQVEETPPIKQYHTGHRPLWPYH